MGVCNGRNQHRCIHCSTMNGDDDGAGVRVPTAWSWLVAACHCAPAIVDPLLHHSCLLLLLFRWEKENFPRVGWNLPRCETGHRLHSPDVRDATPDAGSGFRSKLLWWSVFSQLLRVHVHNNVVRIERRDDDRECDGVSRAVQQQRQHRMGDGRSYGREA
uniref:Uncharacterized protein n=1 Tax=Physcomitrium patens TaxID=3218 RepID=A9RDJ5_PHYPA|nr:hypothetical protein PHYPA_023201 [Physcomitrium patens]